MRVLVTGGGGFVGQWLARALLARGESVYAAGPEGAPTVSGVLTTEERHAIHWIRVDVRRALDVDAAVAQSHPDVVFHLAGVSFVPDAQEAPALAYDVNTVGAVRLLGALGRARRSGRIDPVVLVVGSATQYGRHDASEMPLGESAEQRPATVYAASKAAQEIAALQAHRGEGLRVICTRSFNHSGTGHGAQFLLPALVQRALALRDAPVGKRALRLGADSVRDYLHVADVVEAYLRLVERGTPGEVYNVCSGEGVGARQLAADVLLRVGATADISTDPDLVRESDVPVLVGSPRKLQALGWTTTRSRDDIIDDLIHAATH